MFQYPMAVEDVESVKDGDKVLPDEDPSSSGPVDERVKVFEVGVDGIDINDGVDCGGCGGVFVIESPHGYVRSSWYEYAAHPCMV